MSEREGITRLHSLSASNRRTESFEAGRVGNESVDAISGYTDTVQQPFVMNEHHPSFQDRRENKRRKSSALFIRLASAIKNPLKKHDSDNCRDCGRSLLFSVIV